jgi:hypothetical protein
VGEDTDVILVRASVFCLCVLIYLDAVTKFVHICLSLLRSFACFK